MLVAYVNFPHNLKENSVFKLDEKGEAVQSSVDKACIFMNNCVQVPEDIISQPIVRIL